MAAPGRYFRSVHGCSNTRPSSSATTFAMAALNSGWCARFMATDARDIASVRVSWSTVTAAGTVQLRIETIDATTGKPSGSLYDANAVLNFTPTVGSQLLTFASLPTTGLTAGTEYGIVLLTTVGGTTHTLRSTISPGEGLYPCITLTAADGTTRGNFAEVSNGDPICTVVMEDAVEEVWAFHQYPTTTANNIFTTNATATKFTVPTGATYAIAQIWAFGVVRNGTPAGDLRVRIMDSSNNVVAGTTVTVDKDSLTNVNAKNMAFVLPGVVSLTAGTYRVVFDSASSANSANSWRLTSGVANSSALTPAGYILSTTPDVTATPIVWTDDATQLLPVGLAEDDVTASGSSGGATVPTNAFGLAGVWVG